jgi:hypothetical protein
MYHAISGRFTQSIFAIAVAQLPPPITANFGWLSIIDHFASKVVKKQASGKMQVPPKPIKNRTFQTLT